jgi:3-hydroxyisobutyrate dehydrogenase-like beta-hydroxyacid dehydrogenase
MKIAFLGLGNMGFAMASRLLAAGHTLTVWNRTAARASPLTAKGAKLAAAPSEAISGAEMVFTSFMEDANYYELFGAAGRAATSNSSAPTTSSSAATARSSSAAMPAATATPPAHGPLFAQFAPGSVHLCLSTISATCADWLTAGHAAHQTGYLSAPVVGRPDAAESGNLLQLIAGDDALIARAEPLCRAYASRVLRIAGPPRTANLQKLCINFFLVSTIEAIAESYILAEKLGADREQMAAFVESVYALPGFKGYATRLRDRATDSGQGFTIYGAAKDLRLVREAADSAACPVELADLVSAKFEEALRRGFSNFDISSVQEISRLHAGLDSKFDSKSAAGGN